MQRLVGDVVCLVAPLRLLPTTLVSPDDRVLVTLVDLLGYGWFRL